MDSYSQRFETPAGREGKGQKKKGHNSSYYDDGERKPKFVSMKKLHWVVTPNILAVEFASIIKNISYT